MEEFRSFVPRLVARRFVNDPSVPTEPREEQVSGALLFADISGFTSLTERLAQRGAVGAEELTSVLNTYFGRLIDVIATSGGDILKFAGDALLALWPAPAGEEAAAVLRAAHCGLASQVLLREFRTAPQNPLSLRIGIGSGVLRVLHVGGQARRWELVATGDPLVQMTHAKDHADPGQVALSREAWALISEFAEGVAVPDGPARLDSLRVPVDPAGEEMLQLSPEGIDALRSYMPGNIISFVEGGQTDWLAELRRVTVIFINFPGLTPATPLARAQMVMKTLQEKLSRYEGIINKLSVDDKGATLVAALGLPPLAHEDDPSRAVQAAFAIRSFLREMGVTTSVGIATGQAFCGIVGNARRREYTMMGDVVNLAARLMQAAPRDVLCNEANWESARRRMAFRTLPPLSLKGKAQPVPIYRPVEDEAPAGVPTTVVQTPMVGRKPEISLLSEVLHGLSEQGIGGILTLEGEAGIGKSRLIRHLVDEAQALKLSVITGSGDAIEKLRPYQAWRGVFTHLLGIRPDAAGAERRSQTEGAVLSLAGAGAAELLPLLNPVLSVDFPENEATEAMPVQQRAARANELLVRLLAGLSGPGNPRLLILEDAHWIDSASWALILQVTQAPASLLTVISTRPMPEPAPEEWNAILRDPRTRRIRLQPLASHDSIGLVCLRLGVRSLPDSVADLIRSKTEGNPLFSEELAYALRDSGKIVIESGECRIAPGAAELRASDFPGTVNAVITSRIDKLRPAQQLAVKVASVIGRTFEYRNLCDIFPVKADMEQLAETIRELERKDIARPEPDVQEPAHAFKHVLLQEVAYNLMLFAQRRQLHRTMAEWLEQNYRDAPARAYPLLAHHWSLAVDEAQPDGDLIYRAIGYLQRSAEQALRSNANREAVGLLNNALRLLSLLPDCEERARKEVALQSMLGGPLIVTRGFAAPEVEKAYGRAYELCLQLGKVPELFPTLAGLWNFYTVKTQLHKALDLARQLYDLAESGDRPELMIPAHRALGETSYWLGDLATARRHLGEVIARYDLQLHEQEVLRTGQDPGIVCSDFLGWTLWLLGLPDKALGTLTAALDLAKRLEHLHSVSMTLQNLSMVHQFRRDIPETLADAQSQIDLSREQGFQLWLAGGTIMKGWAVCFGGGVAEGIELMSAGLSAWRATGAELPVPYYLGLLAEGYARAGDAEKGLTLLHEAIDASNRSGEAWWRAELHRLKGELSLAVPEAGAAAAESCFREALEIARLQGARSLELRAACSLARLCGEGEHRREVRNLLKEALDGFSEGFDTADLREARDLMERLNRPGCCGESLEFSSRHRDG